MLQNDAQLSCLRLHQTSPSKLISFLSQTKRSLLERERGREERRGERSREREEQRERGEERDEERERERAERRERE
ncbi:hypothetical protein DPMN_032881 [Dreissena polymorpha]|uniref:Uncharacterized protein n=1 Tax=Dreissena polymorpha TaxID=45954 RepID=A0A9D4M7H7_DREPO|nr:hypothetical protein DPMN_032881 [Dreissena polymorpha]